MFWVCRECLLGYWKAMLNLRYSVLPETCNMAAAMETEQPGLEIFETAGHEEQVQREEQPKLEPFYVERHSWSQLRKLLTDTRKYHGYMMAKAPHDFTFVKKNDPEGPHSDRIYYLGKLAATACALTKQSLQRLFGFDCSWKLSVSSS